MTTKRISLGFAASLVVLGLASAYGSAQTTTDPDQRPAHGRRGPAGPGGPGGRFGGPGGPMGMLPRLVEELNLTDAQKAQVRSIADSRRDEWRALADRARTAHQALEQAVTAGNVDEGLIRQRSAEVARVEADMAVARARTHAEVFQILTPEQRTKAQELRANAEARMKQRGRGRGAF